MKRRAVTPLGKIFIRLKKIDQDQLNQALHQQKESDQSIFLGEILISLGFINNDDLNLARAMQFNYPFINLNSCKVSPEILEKIPKELANNYRLVPLDRFNNFLTVATDNPFNEKAIIQAEAVSGLKIKVFAAKREQLESFILKCYE
ncbi:MAG: hypothetical protein PHV17_02975 [Candidatus Omnitrophica bacterium]|nr:hypothetical protein [Candidatus Omnitrophota bacterium]